MMDEHQMLMSDDESAVESHQRYLVREFESHPPTTSKEKKVIEKFLAMMRKKEVMRKKRRDRFDDDYRSD